MGKPPGRRVGGFDRRADGLNDLLVRAGGRSVMDLGCNRGLVGFEFYLNGATRVDGIELAPDAIEVARSWFADLDVESQFEVGDLTKGAEAFRPFGDRHWDIMLLVAVYHKIKRPPSKHYAVAGATPMSAEQLSAFMTFIATRTKEYLGGRIPEEDIPQLDADFGKAGLQRIAFSKISELGSTAIWKKEG